MHTLNILEQYLLDIRWYPMSGPWVSLEIPSTELRLITMITYIALCQGRSNILPGDAYSDTGNDEEIIEQKQTPGSRVYLVGAGHS